MKETAIHQDKLIEKLKGNDVQTLNTLYRENYGKVERYVIDNSGSPDDARDIYQEAFIALWRNIQLDRINITGSDKLNGYLFRVAQHKWLDELRRRKSKAAGTLAIGLADSEIAEPGALETDYLSQVKKSLSATGSPCKEVLHRFYFLKETMAQIAAAFSWTEATARNNKYRCLQRLRNEVLMKTNND